jgi:hypothetical protein
LSQIKALFTQWVLFSYTGWRRAKFRYLSGHSVRGLSPPAVQFHAAAFSKEEKMSKNFLRRSAAIAATLSGAAFCLALAGPAHATLIAYDSFSYPADSQMTGQGTAATWPVNGGNWTGGTYQVTLETPGNDYNYHGLAHTGNVIDFVGGSAPLYRTLGTTYSTAGNIYYVSFMEDVDSNPAGSYAGVSLFNTAAGKQEQFFMGQDDLNKNWSMELSATGGRGVSNTAISPQHAVLMVVELNGITNTASLFVNPTSLGGSAPATPDATLNLTGQEFSFNEIRIAAGAGQTMDVDEFRLGTTFAAVTPTVPEPATWTMMLLGFAGLGMMGRQSSRKKVAKAF